MTESDLRIEAWLEYMEGAVYLIGTVEAGGCGVGWFVAEFGPTYDGDCGNIDYDLSIMAFEGMEFDCGPGTNPRIRITS